jgi:hypothetical protein
VYDDKFTSKENGEVKVVDYPVYLEMLQKRLYQKKEIYYKCLGYKFKPIHKIQVG